MGKEEDPFSLGLVLEWVYGTIVSTAEKSRDGAKRPLGVPSLLKFLTDMPVFFSRQACMSRLVCSCSTSLALLLCCLGLTSHSVLTKQHGACVPNRRCRRLPLSSR